jgi:hypothetical protein
MTTNVHDPFVRKGEQFSTKRFVNIEYTIDEIYVK